MTTIVAFSAQDVSRLTGLSLRQLASWDRDGFFVPHYAGEDRRLPYSRVYDFRDVVGLRTLAHLRNKYNISRQQLSKINDWLKQHHETPWSSLRFFVGGGKVFFDNPETGERMAGFRPGQTAFPFEMEAVEREMSEEADKLKKRLPEQVGQVVRNRFIKGNAPVVAGTRIPVSAIQDFAQEGYSPEEIIREYPTLTVEDIRAAIEYRGALAKQKRAG